MSRYRIFTLVYVLMVIAIPARGSVAHAGVLVGASFGYTHLSYPDDPSLTHDVVGIPGTAEWGQPGIRIGYLAPGGSWDLNADVGLVHWSSSFGIEQTAFELLPQAQANLRGGPGFRPFLNAGLGIRYEATPSWTRPVSATRPLFGAGIGVRRSVSDDHGFVRAELRYGYVPELTRELSPTSRVAFLAAHQFSVKLGFDLIVSR